MRFPRAAAIAGVLVATVLVPVGQRAAAADVTDPLVTWSKLLPSLTDQYDPNSDNDCTAGRPNCVDITIREMQRRFAPLGQSCDHKAVFALAYLRTTQMYEYARNLAGFFVDTPFVNHEDAIFAKYYFNAYDNWAAGKRSAVPQAWLTAFDASTSRKVTGSGDLLLGMNAHVNRDLPFVLAAIGIAFPDGTSRKPDHDKVDQFLYWVVAPLLAEETARFDQTIDTIHTPYGVGYAGLFQQLVAWRETSWRNAEALVDAPTAADRALVAQQIESYAASQASLIVAQNSYLPPVTTTDLRDAYCAANNATAPPVAYLFGPATAY
jgi:hypothetical protein